MAQIVTLLSACWAFSVPLLCTSGVFVHPCDCESPTGCGHETECSDAPCNVTVIVQIDSSVRAFYLSELAAAPLDHAPLVAVEAMLCSFTLRLVVAPGQDNRPYADSDLPLLI